MTTQVMETEYTILDEDLETPAEPKGRKRGARGQYVGNPEPGPIDVTEEAAQDPAEFAKMLRETVAEAVKQGHAMALDLGLKSASDEGARVLAALKQDTEKLRGYMEQQSKLYAKPQSLCLHVKMNDQPAKKLSTRVNPLLGHVVKQSKIGQMGLKWPMVMGPSGSGKTVLASQLAETFSLPFYAINGAEGVGETSLYGRWTKDGFVPGPVRKAAQNGGVCLLDEFDALNDNVLLSLNTWLASKTGAMLTCPMSGESFPMHKDCYFIAAANTNGKGGDGAYSGRNRLDMASLKRFSLFEVGYDRDLERELCPDSDLLECLWGIREKLAAKNAKDVVSTRDIATAYAQQGHGFTRAQILETLRLSMDKANHDLFKVEA